MLAAHTHRLIAQSAAWLYRPGPAPHVETDQLEDPGVNRTDVVLPGIVELERLVTTTRDIVGIVLRYGYFYGPGTDSATPGPEPTVHVVAAARAAAIAVERGPRGVYNVVDDGALVSNGRARDLLRWEPAARDP